ncbi:MAG: hypothetical protein WCE79_09520, partial [Xanthobacteraceae bacterium]
MRKRKASKPPPLKDPSAIGDEELDTAYRAFRERAKSWPEAKRKAGYAKFRQAFDRRRANDTRITCNYFRFWLVCADKACFRNKSCSGDAMACHDRFWPLVPEKLKFEFRGLIVALNDGLSAEDAVRKVKADWERMEALVRETGQGPAAESVRSATAHPSCAQAGGALV